VSDRDPVSDRLYELLPAIYRVRDAEEGEPLRALLALLDEEFARVESDVAGLYDDWFIETAAEWVVPYIGDLLGVRLLHTVESAGVYSQRAFVANTLRYRRRKGTLAMLGGLARDVTGWGAHAVAFFERLGWTQHLNHLRYAPAPNPYARSPGRLNPPAVDRVGTVNLRSLDVVDRIGGPFDVTTHTVDVRPPGHREGWYNIRNLGVFLWRLGSYPVRYATPAPSADYPDGFHFSPLGNPASLFTNPEREADDLGPTEEAHVAGPVRAVAFFERPERYYGAGSDASLAVYRGGGVAPDDLVLLENVICKDLSDWAPPPAAQDPVQVAVDVRLGRIAFAPGEAPEEGVTVTYHYGFSADLGGGPYGRRESIERAFPGDYAAVVAAVEPDPAPARWFASLADALVDWASAAPERAVITIADNGTYDLTGLALAQELTGQQHLVLQADDRNRPIVRLRTGAGAPAVLTLGGGAGAEATLTLDGLLISGGIQIEAGSLRRLRVRHCTLVPGRALDEEGLPVEPTAPSIAAEAGTEDDPANPALEVEVAWSIVGPLRLPETMTGLTIRDSILDAPEDASAADPPPRIALAQAEGEPGPPTVLKRVTVFGEVFVRELTLASEVLFVHRVEARRRQAGCVRYSYLGDPDSITPRRFRCQPDLALERRRRELGLAESDPLPSGGADRVRDRVRPAFTSVRYGRPGYAQLRPRTDAAVREGAESGAEMGAFEHLRQPQREANLRLRLEEYAPHGLDAGLIYVT
jgi:hypothetical protein